MTKQNAFILYIGELEAGRALAKAVEARNWWVDVSDETDEALALYLTESPDLIVIDAVSDDSRAADTYHHLRSVHTGSILVLTNDRVWDFHAPDNLYTMLPPTDTAELVTFVTDVLGEVPALDVWTASF
ncbi:MAG: hypothetical protein K8L97_29995 [Anaerolineae bacterium]|nr:hypothetical protein [Anaerolineae bacterium]